MQVLIDSIIILVSVGSFLLIALSILILFTFIGEAVESGFLALVFDFLIFAFFVCHAEIAWAYNKKLGHFVGDQINLLFSNILS